MKNTIFILVCAFASIAAHSAELTLPKTFENGEVAEAEDFNANFNYLKSQIAEQQIQLSDVSDNAPWLNRDLNGGKEIEVDCSLDADALRVAYDANISERQLTLIITGSCLGAINWESQAKNQILSIAGNEGAKIVPRVVNGESRVGLISSFGNGVYINDVDIEMGADDGYAILFSRNSNGGLSNVTITGHGTGAGQVGVVVQFGASAYLQTTITGVDYGVGGLKAGSIRMMWSDVTAGTSAVEMDGGQLNLRGTSMTAPTALLLSNGAQALGDGSALNGDLSVNSGSLANLSGASITGSVSLDTAIVVLSGDGIPADILTKVSCSGLSQLEITDRSINNNDGNQCLDKAAWNTLINAAFPQGG